MPFLIGINETIRWRVGQVFVMMEQYNNVQFDEMPNFGNMMKSTHNDRNADDKYNTLYDELLDKCHPGKFIRGDAFDKEIFDKANLIYAELLSKKRR